LQTQEDQGQSALYYFAASGLALDPSLPYAWQEPKSVSELPAMTYGRITGLGLLNRNNAWHASRFAESIHTGVVMACVETFCHTITTKTVVVLDKASIQTRDDFAERLPDWKKHGLIITYLSPSAPA